MRPGQLDEFVHDLGQKLVELFVNPGLLLVAANEFQGITDERVDADADGAVIHQLVDHGNLQAGHVLLEYHEGPRQIAQISIRLPHDRERFERVNAKALGQIGGVGMVVRVLEVRLADRAGIGQTEEPALRFEEVGQPVPVVRGFDNGEVRHVLAVGTERLAHRGDARGVVAGDLAALDLLGLPVFLLQHAVHDVVRVQIDADEVLRLDADGRVALQRVRVVGDSVPESRVRRENIFRIGGEIRFRDGRLRHSFVSDQNDWKLRGELCKEGLSPFSFPDRGL